MTKIIFFVVSFSAVIVGCSEIDDEISTTHAAAYDSRSINFVAQTTKALSNDIEAMMGDDNGFVVYAVAENESSWYEYLGGNMYVYDSDTQAWGWYSSEEPIWPVPFYTMNFYAYYPQVASGFEVAAVAPSSLVGEIEVAQSILDQTDYLASCSGDIVTKPFTGMLSLNFGHIMSKVSFSVMQDAGILTVIRQLGMENIINIGSYDYINSQWYALSASNLGSCDDYVGSAGPFSKYGVTDKVDPIRIDGHELMLIPQSGGDAEGQTPLWDGSVSVDASGEYLPQEAYISGRYRTENTTEDIVGYAFRETSSNDTEWATNSYYYSIYKKNGGIYTGPLYVKVGFKLSSEQLSWVAGSEYDYNIQLNKAGGIYLSEYYYDVDGTNTKIRVLGNPQVGDPVFATDIAIEVTVSNWNYSSSDVDPI
ncbi:MAG: fimbrillin family protein [Rikenellaceae bacterium]